MGSPPNAGGLGKHCVFRSVDKSPAETLYRCKFCPSAAVVIRLQLCADGGIRDVINNVGRPRSLLITSTAHFSVIRMSHEASHARCAIVETAVFRVMDLGCSSRDFGEWQGG